MTKLIIVLSSMFLLSCRTVSVATLVKNTESSLTDSTVGNLSVVSFPVSMMPQVTAGEEVVVRYTTASERSRYVRGDFEQLAPIDVPTAPSEVRIAEIRSKCKNKSKVSFFYNFDTTAIASSPYFDQQITISPESGGKTIGIPLYQIDAVVPVSQSSWYVPLESTQDSTNTEQPSQNGLVTFLIVLTIGITISAVALAIAN